MGVQPAGLWRTLPDLTTRGIGASGDAAALVYRAPRVLGPVPGREWRGTVQGGHSVVRLPHPDRWNGKLIVAGIPAVRAETALDVLLSDVVLQRGYAYAASDKATPGLVLREPGRSQGEWALAVSATAEVARQLAREAYGEEAHRVYAMGLSNGGYVVRVLLEQHASLFDGGVDWSGVLWTVGSRHLLAALPVLLSQYDRWVRGGASAAEARARLVDAGLESASEPAWGLYRTRYWAQALWLYGVSLDPAWTVFQQAWDPRWQSDVSPLADYPAAARSRLLEDAIGQLANSGRIGRPLLSIAGEWDCMISFRDHAAAYQKLVAAQGRSTLHRLYGIAGGNHTDALLHDVGTGQQPMAPYCEAALLLLEEWVEQGAEPPPSGQYTAPEALAPGRRLLTPTAQPREGFAAQHGIR